METLKFYGGSVDSRNIAAAVKVLQDGGIVVFPTDTLYALGCDALNNRAVERLCAVKGLNPEKHLLSIVCDGISMASEYARIDNKAFRILKDSLPGAYTFILPSSTRLPRAFKGRKSVGVRVPDNDVARELARALGHPLLATSVEIDDETEVVEPASISMHYDGRADIILDNGTGGTVPSTIVDITDAATPEVVRRGAAPFDEN